MNRHSFRWQGAAFGVLFWAVAGNWAVWRHDLLTTQELSLTLSVVLIVAGLIGVLLTFWRPGHRATPAPDHPAPDHPAPDHPVTDTPTPPQEEHDGQATHPQH